MPILTWATPTTFSCLHDFPKHNSKKKWFFFLLHRYLGYAKAIQEFCLSGCAFKCDSFVDLVGLFSILVSAVVIKVTVQHTT